MWSEPRTDDELKAEVGTLSLVSGIMQGEQASTCIDSSSIVASANNVQITDGAFSVVRDVHNHYHVGTNSRTAISKILEAIPNFRKIYQDMLSKATEGTGMWLLKGQRFRVWLEPNGDIKIYWGSGMPGAGKTVLASIVIQRLEAMIQEPGHPICVCFVYFRYSDHAGLTVKRVLEILLKQTLERHPEFRPLIEETYSRHSREGTEPTEPQLLTLLSQITNKMFATFYVLDALDEAPPDIQLTVLTTLASLNVKLFITSRPLKAVEAAFPEAETFEIVAQDSDIDIHVTKGINSSAGLLNLLRQEGPSLQEEILSTIKSKSGGMFLHASLQMDALRRCITLHQVKRVLDGFPFQIEDVYLQTWSRILEEPQESVLLAKAMFVWVLHTSRSMTIDELERAVATSPETYKFELDRVAPRATLLELCRGLLIVEDKTQLVRLVHYTAKEHVQRLVEESFPHPHSLLANVCITHLIKCGFQNTTISSEEEFKAALKDDPLLAYASEAWPFHAKQSFQIDDIHHLTTRFLADSSAFPAFTSFNRTFRFDILIPLHMMALYHLPLEFIRDFLTHDPNTATKVDQQTPLALASKFGFEGLVKLLLDDPRLQVNLVNSRGESALMLTTREGHEHIAACLLARPEIQYGHEHIAARLLARPEIQVNLVSNDGASALMLTAQYGHEHIAARLLARPEIQVNLVSNKGVSALILTAQEGHEHIAARLLARPDTQVNLVEDQGFSALMVTAQYGHEHIATRLLARPEIQVSLVSNDGWSALMLTAQHGHEPIAARLLARPEIYFNLVDKGGWSALLIACGYGHKGIVKTLLTSHDVNVNSTTVSGHTALMAAAHEGHEPIVEILLLTPGIDSTVADEDGDTAMSLAQDNGHTGVVKLLEAFELRNSIPSNPSAAREESLDREASVDASGSDSDTSESFYDAEDLPEAVDSLDFATVD